MSGQPQHQNHQIVHHHFHHFHMDNLADGNSPGTSKFPEETINATHTPNWNATHQGVSTEQTLEVKEVPTTGTHDHTTIPTLTPHHKEFILQMLLVLYTLTQSHNKITHTTTKILTHPNYSFQTHTTTKRIIMLTHNKMKKIRLLQTSTMTMTQLDMTMGMDIPMSNTLINTLDNH